MYETVDNAFTSTTVVLLLLAVYTPYFFEIANYCSWTKECPPLLTQFPVRFKV